jgi:hypothetical protein
MPTNVFFSRGVTAEQSLYEDIVVESLKIYGQDLYYIPRVIVRDNVLNDVATSSFYDSYAIEMYISNTDGFEGDQTIMSKFGLEIRDQATFVVARRSWERFVGLYNNNVNSIRPLEGDLLYYPPTKSFFEIKFVEHERPFYQLNNLVVYELQCELFEYSDERFDTGNPDIDAVQTYNAISTVLSISDQRGTGTQLLIGEQVVQGLANGVFMFAEVVNIQAQEADEVNGIPEGSQLLWISNITFSDEIFHEMQEGVRVVGQTSRSSWNVNRIYDIDDIDVDFTFPQNAQAQNREFEVDADSIIDFSESNPFGDPSITYGTSPFSAADSTVVDVPLLVVSIDTETVDTTLITADRE